MDLDVEETFEYQLEHLEEYDNLTQLRLIIQEIEFITDHALQPSVDWFERRMDFVIAYSALNWKELAEQTHDPYLSEKSRTIVEDCVQLMDQWSSAPIFDLSIFYSLVHTVEEVRDYYFKYYTTEEDDLFDIIAGIKQL